MDFTNTSSSYNGKKLSSHIKDGDNHIIKVELWYLRQARSYKNSYGVTMREATGLHEVRVNITRMKLEGGFMTGGLGKFITVGEPQKRQTIKYLEKMAAELTLEQVKEIGAGMSTEASLVY